MQIRDVYKRQEEEPIDIHAVMAEIKELEAKRANLDKEIKMCIRDRGNINPKPGETITQQAVIEAIIDKHNTATNSRKFNAVPSIDFDTEGMPDIPTFCLLYTSRCV